MSDFEPKKRRPIFLDGGRPVKPTIWQRIYAAASARPKYFRFFGFVVVWLPLSILFLRHHPVASGLLGIAIGLSSVIVWDAFQAKRELRRMHRETEFLVWFDRVNAIASQYGWKFFKTPGWRKNFQDGLTPEQAFDLAKPGAEKSANRAGVKSSKISRIHGGLP
jgi:hypothetical protein